MENHQEDAKQLTEIDEAWIKLAQQRADEIHAGTAETFPAEQVIDEMRRSLEK